MTPEFAILGHPNEGKSSVLSTLAEDDSVRVSPTPGETTESRTFPVVIDGREVLRFTDTPGFQNPGRVLSELQQLTENEENPLKKFREYAANIPELHDDCELLGPVERGAGIIYVVDGSRPVRNVDRAEMEILRLTGKPRMAIINCKADDVSSLFLSSNISLAFRSSSTRFSSNIRFSNLCLRLIFLTIIKPKIIADRASTTIKENFNTQSFSSFSRFAICCSFISSFPFSF